MRWITAIKCFLLMSLVVGLLGMPLGVVLGFEPDGGTPAEELHQRKRLAQIVLVGGGITAIAAACGLYIAGLAHRRRP